ncbi:hypothetical protein EV426DRAFT_686660 [Tirmania nivea]|nr:hypothetical protein EV426DRAFT_686660 [Tirmania nivea]
MSEIQHTSKMLTKPSTRPKGPLRSQPTPGKLRDAPQPAQSSSYSSRPLRPLAPKAQCAHPAGVMKRRMSQTTDLSKLALVTVRQVAAVPTTPAAAPRPPAMPTVLENPPTGLPECKYNPCWINNNHNVNILSTSITRDMSLTKQVALKIEHGGGSYRSIQESAIQQPIEASASFKPRMHSDHTVEIPDTHFVPGTTHLQQATTPDISYSGQLPHQPQDTSCAQCPSIWCFHLESIMLLVPGQKDLDDQGMSTLMRSYKNLRQHIHDAHLSASRAVCSLCEDLFCYHLANLTLLEGGMVEVSGLKLDLGRSFMTLRTHIREAHGGH